jgi:hypothetical protein
VREREREKHTHKLEIDVDILISQFRKFHDPHYIPRFRLPGGNSEAHFPHEIKPLSVFSFMYFFIYYSYCSLLFSLPGAYPEDHFPHELKPLSVFLFYFYFLFVLFIILSLFLSLSVNIHTENMCMNTLVKKHINN